MHGYVCGNVGGVRSMCMCFCHGVSVCGVVVAYAMLPTERSWGGGRASSAGVISW